MPRPLARASRRTRAATGRGRPGVRLAGAALVGLVLAANAVAPARADDGVPLDPALCRWTKGTDPTSFKPWQLDRLRMREVWALRDGRGAPLDGSGITIAVIDTGVSNANTKYFDSRNVTVLNYLPREDADVRDGYSCDHGTAVTSLIVGRPDADPRTGFAGVAPGAKVVAMRSLKVALDQENRPTNEDVHPTVLAIRDAIARKVQVINLSQAMSQGTPELQQAVAEAVAAGIVVVAAAGNVPQGLRGPAYPASYPGVIAVGMTQPDDTPSPTSYSAPGMTVSVGAPGELVATLLPSGPGAGQSFGQQSGTSFAAPLVSGVVALMLQKEPDLTPAQVRQRLVETADPPARTVPDPQLGHGVVNPLRALAGPPVAPRSVPEPAPTATPWSRQVPAPADPRPRVLALGAAGLAAALTALGVVVRFVVPAAARRQNRPAARD